MKKFGTNQTIAVVGFSVGYVVVWLSTKFMDPERALMIMEFTKTYVPIAIATILGLSAAIKIRRNGTGKVTIETPKKIS